MFCASKWIVPNAPSFSSAQHGLLHHNILENMDLPAPLLVSNTSSLAPIFAGRPRFLLLLLRCVCMYVGWFLLPWQAGSSVEQLMKDPKLMAEAQKLMQGMMEGAGAAA